MVGLTIDPTLGKVLENIAQIFHSVSVTLQGGLIPPVNEYRWALNGDETITDGNEFYSFRFNQATFSPSFQYTI